jgi:hypothetical protein
MPDYTNVGLTSQHSNRWNSVLILKKTASALWDKSQRVGLASTDTACMMTNIDKLSPRCRAQFGQPVVGPEPIRACSSHPGGYQCQRQQN